MSLPPVNATTIALNQSGPGTTELYGKMMLGVGIGGAAICLGAFVYSKMNPPNNNVKTIPTAGGLRHTLRKHRKHRIHRNRTCKS